MSLQQISHNLTIESFQSHAVKINCHSVCPSSPQHQQFRIDGGWVPCNVAHKHVCYLVLNIYPYPTKSSAIAEGPLDASCQLESCQLPRNSAVWQVLKKSKLWSWRVKVGRRVVNMSTQPWRVRVTFIVIWIWLEFFAPHVIFSQRLTLETSNSVHGSAMRSLSLLMSECSLSGRGQGHVSNFYIVDIENFATASRRCTGDIHNTTVVGLSMTTIGQWKRFDRVTVECICLLRIGPP